MSGSRRSPACRQNVRMAPRSYVVPEPALLAAHVCKAGALFGVAEGELVSNGAGVASGVGAADPKPNGQATPLSLSVLALTNVPEGEL